MGTGWLIQPDLLVTAGHNVYSWSKDGSNDKPKGEQKPRGRAVDIKCYIGYCGRDSVGKDGVQERQAKKVLTTAEWLASSRNSPWDVAFIQVGKPFTGELNLFSYLSTPERNRTTIGVVGYPGDKFDAHGEYGAVMWEQFAEVDYDIKHPQNKQTMLEYTISTWGGKTLFPFEALFPKTLPPPSPYNQHI